jgi:hypothetical protein
MLCVLRPGSQLSGTLISFPKFLTIMPQEMMSEFSSTAWTDFTSFFFFVFLPLVFSLTVSLFLILPLLSVLSSIFLFLCVCVCVPVRPSCCFTFFFAFSFLLLLPLSLSYLSLFRIAPYSMRLAGNVIVIVYSDAVWEQ